MVNRIRASDPRGSKFRVGSRVRQELPGEDRRTDQPKRCEYNNKNKNNSPKTLNDKEEKKF